MDLRIGYFPVLEAALALRQCCQPERFAPFNPAMQGIRDRLGEEGRAQAEQVAEATDGWLAILGILLDPASAGPMGLEEGFLQLQREPLAALPLIARGPFPTLGRPAVVPPEPVLFRAGALLAQVLRSGIGPEAARCSRALLDAAQAIDREVGAVGAWPYLLGISDRLRRPAPGEIAFRTRPECRLAEAEVERLVLCPSLVATRRLTFWRNGPALVFFIGAAEPAAPHDPPDSLLLTALAVGDRTRLRMLRRLGERACTNLEMAGFLGLNPSTVSRHFKVFKDAGLVDLREDPAGRTVYELAPEGLEAGFRAIAAFIGGQQRP